MDYEQLLVDSTEELYRVFSSYEKPAELGDPLKTYTPEQLKSQKIKTLRQFTIKELNDYAWHGLTLWCSNNVQEIKKQLGYWLPRLLEIEMLHRYDARFLFDRDANLIADVDFVFSKIVEADWKNWPDSERSAITKWLFAWLDACLEYRDIQNGRFILENRQAFSCIIQMNRLGLPIAHAWAVWDSHTGIEATLQLLNCVSSLPNEPRDTHDDYNSIGDYGDIIRSFLTDKILNRFQTCLDETIRNAVDGSTDPDGGEKLARDLECGIETIKSLRLIHKWESQ